MIRKMTALALACSLGFTLSGCNDDDPAPVTLVGKAAIGAALANANVRAVGANGAIAETTTDANGDYSLNSSGLTPPIFIRVSGGTYDDDGNPATPNVANAGTLYSLSAALSGRANTTPLTTLVLQQTFGESDLTAAFVGWDVESDNFSLFDFSSALNIVAANFRTQMLGFADARKYNFFTLPFNADGTGIDGLLDSLSCSVTGTSAPLTVNCTYDGTPVTYSHTPNLTGFTLGQNLTIEVKVGVLPSRALTPQVMVPPPSESLFCASTEYINAFSAAAQAAAGSVNITDCSLVGNVGVMKGTVTTPTLGTVSGKATFTWK